MVVVVRGIGDIGSAVAHSLVRAGYGVVIHDSPKPTTTRRGMAFADTVFDGRAVRDGVEAVLADDLDHIQEAHVERPRMDMSVSTFRWTPARRRTGAAERAGRWR